MAETTRRAANLQVIHLDEPDWFIGKQVRHKGKLCKVVGISRMDLSLMVKDQDGRSSGWITADEVEVVDVPPALSGGWMPQ